MYARIKDINTLSLNMFSGLEPTKCCALHILVRLLLWFQHRMKHLLYRKICIIGIYTIAMLLLHKCIPTAHCGVHSDAEWIYEGLESLQIGLS